MITRSALSSASIPGMLSVVFGLISPVFLSIAKSTVHLKPWWVERILPSWGIVSSDRYSSSPLRRTTCLPLPGPSPPSKTSQGFSS
jgi:hypothetical protein